MHRLSKRIPNAVHGCVLTVLMIGCISWATADEKKGIPDHTKFESCGSCHSEKQHAWENSGHGAAIRRQVSLEATAKDCSGCHAAKPGSGTQKDGSHHKISCRACHDTKDTGHAHRLVSDPAKLCSACHTQGSVFWGKGAKGIEDSRNFHSGVPCVSCHMTEENHAMKVLRPDDPGLTGKRQDTCTACHMDNNREARVQQIQEWQSTYDESMTPLLADVKSIDGELKKNPGLLDSRLKTLLADVKSNLSILQKDGSRGFHNFVFSLEITSMAERDLKEIRAGMKK